MRTIVTNLLPETLRATMLGLVLLGLGTAAQAQNIRGVLAEQGTGKPVDAALVVLIDGATTQIAGSLSDPAGEFRIQAPAGGPYRLTVERVGYQTTLSDEFWIAAGETVEQRLVVPVEATTLEGIVVKADRRCEIRPREGEETQRVWEESRKALNAAAFSQQQELYSFQMARHQRSLNPSSLEVLGEEVRSVMGYGPVPYVSAPAEELAQFGYIRGLEHGDSAQYYAPDAEVLLSEVFLDSHCFRLTERSGPDEDLIGLSFEPVKRKKQQQDIEGVLWLDPQTSELKHLEYRYLGLPVKSDKVGGRIEFERLPSGAWIVRRWRIRMPQIQQEAARAAFYDDVRYRMVGLTEAGGEVLSIRDSRGRVLGSTERAVLTGMVHDSTANAPLEGATIYLAGTQYRANADEHGRFELTDLPDGTYSVGFMHPRLESLGILPEPRSVTLVSGQSASVDLAIPASLAFEAAGCTGSGGRTALLAGTVRDRGEGVPLPGAKVFVSWGGAVRTGGIVRGQQGAEIQAGTGGRYHLCDVPVGLPVTLRAEALGRNSKVTTLQLSSGEVRTADVQIATADPVRVAGQVVDFETGEPVSGALVRASFGGDQFQQLTDPRGRFTFNEVSPGGYALAVEHVAYGDHRETLQIRPGTANQFEVRLPRRAIPLQKVVVTAVSETERAKRAYPRRRSVLTRADIEKRLDTGGGVEGVIRGQFPGVRIRKMYDEVLKKNVLCVESSRGRTWSTRDVMTTPKPSARRDRDDRQQLQEAPQANDSDLQMQQSLQRCSPVVVVIDDVPAHEPESVLLSLPPHTIESIEYQTALDAGTRYGSAAAGGALIIYTRGNGPHTAQGR